MWILANRQAESHPALAIHIDTSSSLATLREMPPSTRKLKRHFRPWSRTDELTLLKSDDAVFSATRHYLKPLIEQVLARYELSLEEQRELARQLGDDVPIAAKRFLTSIHSQAADYTFATYFTWYISERLKTKKRRI